MQLITLHKSLQSMELAFRQGIDCSWLIRKASDQIALLKRDAETTSEDELAQGAGQLLAYLDTVSEGRLDLDEEGVKVIRDFVTIFKDAMGDAAPGLRALDNENLEAWNSRYQSLMARMKPIEEDIDLSEVESETLVVAAEGSATEREVQGDSVEEAVEEADGQVADEIVEEKAPVGFENAEESDQEPDEEPLEESAEESGVDDLSDAEIPTLEKLPPYDPSEELHVRDVVIPDAEIRSAREFMELGERKPELVGKPDNAEIRTSRPFDTKPTTKDDHGDGTSVKSPVQLEEVERLKKKLLELHQKQEMLSSKMSGILGNLKQAVKGEQKEGDRRAVEELDLEQLEDIIFMGRKKG